MSTQSTQLVPFEDRRLNELNEQISASRARLAALDATFTSEKAKVDALRARLFFALRGLYEKRDEAELYLKSRRKLLEDLLRKTQRPTTEFEREFNYARDASRQQYEQAATDFKTKQKLSPEEEVELHQLWKKLVRLYHPDRFNNEPDKLQAYTNLTAAINRAKEAGDLATLREIAKDPVAYLHRMGWATLEFGDLLGLGQLEKLLQSLQQQIESAQTELTQLRCSSEYDLMQVIGSSEAVFDAAVAKQENALHAQISQLEAETGLVLKNIARASKAHGP